MQFRTEYSEELSNVIHPDATVAHTILENGFQYFVKYNRNPENRIILHFCVGIGSLVEDEDQRGLAHILEHMAFNGSTNFAPQQLVEYFESIGMRFGAHVNAVTSFDKTVYKLEIPADSPEILANSLRVVRDWCSELSFLPEQIEKERLVGLEERRQSLSGVRRAMEKMLATTYWNARHADRLPIGTEESLQTFSHDALRRMYADWYRPDTSALVVVGDMDVDAISEAIRAVFVDWKVTHRREKPNYAVPMHEAPLFDVAQEDSFPFSMFSITQKKRKERIVTEGEFMEYHILPNVVEKIIAERISFASQRVESKIQSNRCHKGTLSVDCVTDKLDCIFSQQSIREGIFEVVALIKQLRLGVTEGELQRATQAMLAHTKMILTNKNSLPSRYFISLLEDWFHQEEDFCSTEDFCALEEKWIARIALEDVNQMISTYLEGNGLVYHLVSPEKDVPTLEEFTHLLEDAWKQSVEAYLEDNEHKELLENPLQVGSIVAEAHNAKFGVTEWVLSNGIQVWAKQVEYKEDRILFSGYGRGGYSLIDDKVSAKRTLGVGDYSNKGRHSAIDLDKILHALQGQFNFSVQESSQSVQGASIQDDLSTLLQYYWLYTQQTQLDSTALEKLLQIERTKLQNQLADPDRVFSFAERELMFMKHPRTKPNELADLDVLDIDVMKDTWKQLVQPAADMKYVFITSMDVNSLKDTISATLGALPSVTISREKQNREIFRFQGQYSKVLYIETEEKSKVSITFIHRMQYVPLLNLLGTMLAQILEKRLRLNLREDKAGTYHASAVWYHADEEEPVSILNVDFGCDPKRMEELKKHCYAEITNIYHHGVSEDELEVVKKQLLSQHEKRIKEDVYWNQFLYQSIRRNRKIHELLDVVDLLEQVSIHTINQHIQHIMGIDDCMEVVSLPKSYEYLVDMTTDHNQNN